jgi:predicted PurR-regulated permease PerM
MIFTNSSSLLKNIIIVFLIIIGLYYGKDFLIPLAIGGLVATLFLPFYQWMKKKKYPKGLAALICVLILLLSVLSIGALLGWQISELTKDFAVLKQRAIDTGDRTQQYIFNHLGIPLEKQLQIIKNEQPYVADILQFVAGSLASIFTNFFLTLLYVFCLLYYGDHIRCFLVKLSSPSQRKEMELVINSATQVSQQYLVGLTKIIVCLWIMYGIGFSTLGLKNALFFAILCGLLEIVPFIGNITGSSITVLVSAVQGASLPVLGGIVVTYVLVQFIQGWILEPLIVGKQVKINPLFTIIALVIGELIWGIPGIFIAIPFIAMFKIVCDHIEPLKPYGFLIGEIETAKKELNFIKKIKRGS